MTGEEMENMNDATKEISTEMLEQATGGVGSGSAPQCPICGTKMEASGIVINGQVVSGKWICPKCKYSVTISNS